MRREYNEWLSGIISKKRKLSWSQFKEAAGYVAALAAPGEAGQRFWSLRVVRCMEMLGYCDLDLGPDGVYVHAAPPALALLPASRPAAVVAGMGIARIRDAASQTGGVEAHESSQPALGGILPARILVECEDVAGLRAVADAASVHFEECPAGWRIVNAAGDIERYLKHLDWRPAFHHTSKTARHFDPATVRMSPGCSDAAVSIQSYARQAGVPVFDYFLQSDGRQARVDLDWGRYAALRAHGRSVLYYDPRLRALAVPGGAPLPGILARAACLCSGWVPMEVPSGAAANTLIPAQAYSFFGGVVPCVAEVIAGKLGQTLIPLSMDAKVVEVQS